MSNCDTRGGRDGRKFERLEGVDRWRWWRPSYATALFVTLLATATMGMGGQPAWAQSPPTDPSGFTTYIAKQFRKSMLGSNVRIQAPLRLLVTSATGDHDASLDTVFSSCQRNAGACDMLVRSYVAQMSAYYQTQPAPLDRVTLRVIVRTEPYLDALRRGFAGQGGPVTAPLPGGYWLISAADLPTAIRMVSVRDLTGLGLSADQALAIGKQNMRAEMRAQIKAALAGDHRTIKLMAGSPYASSLFAFPELWAPVAAAFGGGLFVAVPSSDTLLCGDEAVPGMAPQLADAARTVIAHADRPFSATVFRWSPTGWTPLPKHSQALR